MRICILGATGLVGRESLHLAGRAWPAAEIICYASRDQRFELDGARYEVRAATGLEAPDAPRGDIALVALDDDHSKRYVPRLLDLGYRVVDKSGTYRGDPAVPLVVAGANTSRVDASVRLVANPNCTTIPLMLALAPLHKVFGLTSVTVSTYQAVSGAGIAALDTFLDATKIGSASGDRLGRPYDAAGYAGNTVPHNGGTDDSGFSSEERKLVFESRKVLELPGLAISAQCCRVAVAVGHYENAWVTFEQPVTPESAAAVLGDPGRAPFVRYVPGAAGEGLSSRSCVEDRDRALAGRLRVDPRDPTGRSLCLTVVSDNLRLGAATNAVRIGSRWFPSQDPELQAS